MSDKDLIKLSNKLRIDHLVTHDTLMPFGKYKGTVLDDIPASYLLWWLFEHDELDTCPGLTAYCKKYRKVLENQKIEEEIYDRLVEDNAYDQEF